VTSTTHEAAFLTVMRASMHMVVNAVGQGKAAADSLSIDEAVKVNPLATVQ